MGYDMYRESGDQTNAGEDYFRLNIWGMSEACDLLLPIGIVRLADVRFPPPPGENVSDEEFEVYRAAVQAVTDGTQELPGIPSYKFSTNDGWLVWPVEVTSGVSVADTNSRGWRESLPDWVMEFVVWMEQGAAQNVGFRVW